MATRPRPGGAAMPVLWLASLLVGARGWIRLNGVFTDHMVLQRDHAGLPPVRIFGLAYTNETVVVEWLDGGSLNGSLGPWRVQPETTGPARWPANHT